MLSGSTPDDAFFVRCDETTMTADDRANGRIVARIGVTLADPPGPLMLTLSFTDRGAESYARIG
jgi:phage tail sheath protein FI